jgi:hypothetical protein
MTRIWLTLAGGTLALAQLGATDCGTVLRDPGFDVWCGDQLCSWKLIRGDVRRVGTWHAEDSGIEFLGTDSAIQQLAPVNSRDGTCIEFTLVANVASDAEMFLHVDIQGDGTIERSERIPTSSWKPLSFHLLVEPPYDGIRFELAKRGAGTAVLAQVGAQLSGGCEGFPPIRIGPRPNGSSCLGADDCASGICATSPFPAPGGSVFGTVCMGCEPAAPACDAGEVCGTGAPLSPVLAVPVQCVPEGSRELAEQCLSDAECAAGTCSAAGLCSSCGSTSDCGGDFCGPAWQASDDDPFTPDHVGPDVCRPGQGANVSGEPCGRDADCASGRCQGTERKVCRDGRSCTSPASCPIENGLVPGPCTLVGTQGGTCT